MRRGTCPGCWCRWAGRLRRPATCSSRTGWWTRTVWCSCRRRRTSVSWPRAAGRRRRTGRMGWRCCGGGGSCGRSGLAGIRRPGRRPGISARGSSLLISRRGRTGSRLQDRLNWLNRLVVCCDCNRPTLDSIRAAGFTVAQVEHTALPKAPPFVRPAIVGSATGPAAAPRAHQDGDLPTAAPPRAVRPAG